MSSSAFIQPLDVWSFRGNRLFGDAGSWGAVHMPPPPSVLAGALRSAILVQDGVDLHAFAASQAPHPLLGTPAAPGPFSVSEVLPARCHPGGHIEPVYPLPADLVAMEMTEAPKDRAGSFMLSLMRLHRPHPALMASQPLPLLPVLRADSRSKPLARRWLSAAGMRSWLAGQLPASAETLSDQDLWLVEERVGVALQAETRRADDGKLFSVQTVACRPQTGLAVRVQGAQLRSGILRLGGDGRSARLSPEHVAWPEPDYEAIARAGRARLYLSSPGLFPLGWLPTGCQPPDQQGAAFELGGVRARLVAAAVPRAAVISGFDLARGQPKSAQRAVAAGAVYWLDQLQASAQDLARLVEQGLWPHNPHDPGYDAARRAEGYNRCLIAAWPTDPT
ncbi:MAG: type III-B CRISPR module-associated Cmr3 family protein [Tepidimonas sp.]|uniref:type III-B CRISPR module-associated Cmr3 family protein n=1 Tax=Tepidimonas sp. TaxID=2002775 RepID=UPI00298F3CA2|nr:type III-B CRISPR module-associated Cmr3 family protein [Tepidimonas sp.]MDW8336750.1 type III-B CRISPR module-associated Cmr3 family protein [Tepidimonas sp.]